MKALDALFVGLDRSDAPGLVVGVAHQGQLLYRRAFGMASIEHGVALTPRSRMRLASVSKHITCAAALLLVDEGRLDLDAPATQVLPELKTLRQPPTLRQLMTHTSGLRCAQELLYLSCGLAFQPAGAALAMQFAQGGVNAAPGTTQLYNNGGYGLLSLAIERASGQGFEAFMKARLFDPLGMADSASVPNDMLIVPGMASLHLPLPDGRWRRGLTPLEDNKGEGAIVTTVDDMLRWLAHLRAPDGRIGRADTWTQLTTPATLADGSTTPYALGLNRHRYRGVEVLQHGGSLLGAASQMVTVPAHALDIIIMSNGALVNPVELAWRIVDETLADQLHGAPAALVGSAGFEHLFGAQQVTRYHGASGMVYGFGDAGGKLGLSLFGTPPMPVLRDRGDAVGFGFAEAGMGPLEFSRAELAARGDDGGPPPTLRVRDGTLLETFHRLPPAPADTLSVGRALVGHYRVDDLLSDADVVIDGQRLLLHLHGPRGLRSLVLQALSPEVYTLQALDPMAPIFAALTVQRRGRAVQGFRVSSGRARGLRFERVTKTT